MSRIFKGGEENLRFCFCIKKKINFIKFLTFIWRYIKIIFNWFYKEKLNSWAEKFEFSFLYEVDRKYFNIYNFIKDTGKKCLQMII